jgi:acetyl esterase/lipase
MRASPGCTRRRSGWASTALASSSPARAPAAASPPRWCCWRANAARSRSPSSTHPDPSPYLGQFVWTPDANRFGWTSLLGHAPGLPDVSPFAAPARATDLSGLPPTFMSVGALDLFLEEDLDYARRLIRAGVPTEVHVYPGAPHGFMMLRDTHVSRTFARDSLAALAKAAHG